MDWHTDLNGNKWKRKLINGMFRVRACQSITIIKKQKNYGNFSIKVSWEWTRGGNACCVRT